jgi:hypothetical protein
MKVFYAATFDFLFSDFMGENWRKVDFQEDLGQETGDLIVYFEIKLDGRMPTCTKFISADKFEVKEIVQTFRGFRGISDDTVVVLLKTAKDDSFIWQKYEEIVEKCENIAASVSKDDLLGTLLKHSGVLRCEAGSTKTS